MNDIINEIYDEVKKCMLPSNRVWDDHNELVYKISEE